MKVTHTCTQCREGIAYIAKLHGKSETTEIRSQGFMANEVYIKSNRPRLSVAIKVTAYQEYEELCRSCAIKAAKQVIDGLATN